MPYVVDGYVQAGYIGQPGSPVKFSRLGDTCPFGRSPLRPAFSVDFVQSLLTSAGAERSGRGYYVKNQLIDIEWPRLSGWDTRRLLTWWRTVARGMSNTFTYTDVNGVATVVRFAVPTLPEIREIAYDTFQVRCQLRVA